MRIEWECNKIFDDGGQSNVSYYAVYDDEGNWLGAGDFENYTFISERVNIPEHDRSRRVRREFCYKVTDDFGWWNHGIDKNAEYRTNNDDHYYGAWGKPEHTHEEVKKMIEDHIVECFTFDPDEYRREFEERFANKKRLMEDAKNLTSIEVDDVQRWG